MTAQRVSSVPLGGSKIPHPQLLVSPTRPDIGQGHFYWTPTYVPREVLA